MTMNDDDTDKENDNNQSNLLSIDHDVVDSQSTILSTHHPSQKRKRNRRKKIGRRPKKRKISPSSSLNTTTPPPLAKISNSNAISSRSSSYSSTQSAASSNNTITTRSRSSSSTNNNTNSTTSNIIVTPSPPPRPIELLGPKGKRLNFEAAEHQRYAISNLYANKYYNKDPHFPINGRNGIVAQIMSELHLKPCMNGTVTKVIIETKKALDKGLTYDGKRKVFTKPHLRKVQDGSLAQQLLIDCKEKNKYSNRMTAKILSAQIPEFKDNPIGPSAVSNALRHMKHPK